MRLHIVYRCYSEEDTLALFVYEDHRSHLGTVRYS